jgi:hypothetical protein
MLRLVVQSRFVFFGLDHTCPWRVFHFGAKNKLVAETGKCFRPSNAIAPFQPWRVLVNERMDHEMKPNLVQNGPGTRLPVVRCAGVGAIVLGVLFVACWLGEGIGVLNASHMYIALFTIAPAASFGAILIGFVWSIVFGAFTGAVTALAYNALGTVRR